MNVLLLAMPDCSPHFDARRWRPPNLAIVSIAGNLPNHNVVVGDLVLRRERVRDAVLELLEECHPQVVGLTATSFQFSTAAKIARLIKKVTRDVKIVVGGYHATLMYDELGPSGEYFDYIIRGEGDLAFGELLEAIEGRRKIEEVLGISYRRNGNFVHNPPRPLEDLSKIKIPDRTKRLWKGFTYYGYNLDVIESSRGCVMPCNFCCMEMMYGKSFRTYPIPRVIEDIRSAKAYGAEFIIFADDNFSLDVKRFEALCDAMVEAGLNEGLGYIIQASSLGIASSETLVEKMARAGFKIVFLGIENVSEENLKMLRKGNIIEKTKIAVERLHKYDIMIVGGMIVGNPEDKEEDIARNYRYFQDLSIDFFADQILTPYPRTSLREEMIKRGLVTNLDDFSKYNCFWANVRTNYLSSEELQFYRWKHNKATADYICTTPAFIKNYPLGYYYRVYYKRPVDKLKHYLFNSGKTEQELYREDMQRALETNAFPDLEDGG